MFRIFFDKLISHLRERSLKQRLALALLLVLVTVQMGRAALTDFQSLALMAAASVALIGFRVNLLWIVAAAAGLSLFLF